MGLWFAGCSVVKRRKPISVSADEKRIPPPYGKVSAVARTLIALMMYTDATKAEIRKCLDMRQSEIDKMLRQIRKDDFAKYVLRFGLPAMFGEPLEDDMYVRCNSCDSLVRWVPCVACCTHEDDFLDRTDRHRAVHGEVIPPESDEPTKFLAGTPQKVSVMRYRVEMGMQPFCSRDAKGIRNV
jgi:hypothetical protein